MYRLAGEFECKIDDKGRVKLPAALLKQFSNQDALKFTVNRGYERHLILYTDEVWKRKTEEIDQLNINLKDHRKALRYFYRGATKVNPDSAGRVLVPKSLIEYAGLEKEIVLFAYQDIIEIWAKAEYEVMISQEPDEYAEISEEIFSKKSEPRDE